MADQIGIQLKNPRVSTLGGNSFAQSIALTNIDLEVITFLQDVEGKFYGIAHIPSGYGTVTTAAIKFDIIANATTGATSWLISTAAVADAETANVSLTAETIQHITVPGTAYLTKEVTFSMTTAPTADDFVVVELFHDGDHASDTLAVDTHMINIYLELT